MQNIIEWIFNNFVLYSLIIVVWILFWLINSFYYRKKKGKPIFDDPQGKVIFKEKNASGNSKKNILTKISGARNCLKVILSDNQMIITPSFPFNLMFLPKFTIWNIL